MITTFCICRVIDGLHLVCSRHASLDSAKLALADICSKSSQREFRSVVEVRSTVKPKRWVHLDPTAIAAVHILTGVL